LNGVLEQIQDALALLHECKRVLKPGGVLIVIMPHFTNCGYYADITHVRPASYQLFKHLCSDHWYKGLQFEEQKIKFLFSKNKQPWDYLLEPLANAWPNVYEYTPLKIFQCGDIYTELRKPKH